MVCWNVLAHIHTHHNWAAHGAPRKTLETPAQRDARHRRVARTLARLAPDVALLQEADESFMPVQWQPEEPLPCGERLDGYTPYRSYSDRGDGCVVLLRQQSFRRDKAVDTVYSPAADFLPPQQGVMVHARRVGAAEAEPPFAIASVHLKWGAARAHLANPIPRPFAPVSTGRCSVGTLTRLLFVEQGSSRRCWAPSRSGYSPAPAQSSAAISTPLPWMSRPAAGAGSSRRCPPEACAGSLPQTACPRA